MSSRNGFRSQTLVDHSPRSRPSLQRSRRSTKPADYRELLANSKKFRGLRISGTPTRFSCVTASRIGQPATCAISTTQSARTELRAGVGLVSDGGDQDKPKMSEFRFGGGFGAPHVVQALGSQRSDHSFIDWLCSSGTARGRAVGRGGCEGCRGTHNALKMLHDAIEHGLHLVNLHDYQVA